MLKILVVDEHKEFRNYLNEMITSRNDQYLELTDALSLNSFCRIHKPDVVIIDLQMKQVNAFKAAEELIAEIPGSRVLMLSGFDDKRLKMKAEEIGAAAFISKENLFDFYKTINSNPELLINN